MSINELIFRNLKKNLKNYYLYVFALIFSSALYFAFVTLQYDPAMDEISGTIKGGAAIKAASVLLIVIVAVFLVYANNIFIKRRSKEVGLFQLIGMTKNGIFRLLTAENFLLYFGAVLIGIIAGFAFSKLMMMILLKILGIEAVAELHFSQEALIQTIAVFSLIYLIIMGLNYLFIKRQSILSLFRVTSSTEGRVKSQSIFEIIIGILGIGLIATGYFASSRLFSGDFTEMGTLYFMMIFILASVILGTYLFYRGSVSFIFNMVRKSKKGYLNINEVLSLSSIMFRMKSNSLLLTVITTVSALAIGLLCLSYISYYSIEKNADSNYPHDFGLSVQEDAEAFLKKLEHNDIAYEETVIEVLQSEVNIENIISTNLDIESGDVSFDETTLAIISDKDAGRAIAPNEAVFAGYNSAMEKFISFKNKGEIILKGQETAIPLQVTKLDDNSIVPYHFTGGGMPAVIVNEDVYKKLKSSYDPNLQLNQTLYIGIDITDDQLTAANDIFNKIVFKEDIVGLSLKLSKLSNIVNQRSLFGLTMFIVGFLGLTFLITSGCILYFKQMDESEEEKPNYTILRKLGFTQWDLLKGIRAKQLFSFGIPLLLGLSHGYFAVQSGWFFFGTELWTPMIIVMVLYTALYSIFGILSVLYYKKVIQAAL